MDHAVLYNGGGGAGPQGGIGFEWDPEAGSDWQKPRNSDINTADVFRIEQGVPLGGD